MRTFIGESICSFQDLGRNDKVYGYKGETLHALTFLSNITIVTRHKNSKFTYRKTINRSNNIFTTSMLTVGASCSGTTIIIENIFNHAPVRLKNVHVENEILNIKTFLRHLSILHHDITWNFTDLDTGKSLLSLEPKASVMDRFLDIHPSIESFKMTVSIFV